MGSGNKPEDLTSVYIMGRLDALHNVQKRIDELEQKIADLEAELEKRPVVYCYRNKHGDLARHFGSWSLALWSTPEEQKPIDPELDWKIEVYTGSNNQEQSKTYTGALGGLF